jgi:hypothetical protein
MPKLTCPECDTPFHTAGGRYTTCPVCDARLDTRRGDVPAVVTPGRQLPAEDERPRRPTARRVSGPIVVRRHSDATPKAMLALVVMGVIGLFAVVACVLVVIYTVTGTTKSPTPMAALAGPPGFAPGQPAPPAANDGLPGVDPGQLPQIGGEVPDDDLSRLFPPGMFPPGFGPGGPPAAPPAPAVQIVTLSNLRDAPGLGGRGELMVDFSYAAGNAPALFDTLILRTAGGTAEVRLHLLGRGQGTIKVRMTGPGGNLGGNVEAWMERKASPIPGTPGQVVSNVVKK